MHRRNHEPMTVEQARKVLSPWGGYSALLHKAALAMPPHLRDPEIVEACEVLARNNESRANPNDEVFYHGTHKDSLDTIMKSGLTDPFLASRPSQAECWAEKNYADEEDARILEVKIHKKDHDNIVPDYNLMPPEDRADFLGRKYRTWDYDVRGDLVTPKRRAWLKSRSKGLWSAPDLECGGESSLFLGHVPPKDLSVIPRGNPAPRKQQKGVPEGMRIKKGPTHADDGVWLAIYRERTVPFRYDWNTGCFYREDVPNKGLGDTAGLIGVHTKSEALENLKRQIDEELGAQRNPRRNTDAELRALERRAVHDPAAMEALIVHQIRADRFVGDVQDHPFWSFRVLSPRRRVIYETTVLRGDDPPKTGRVLPFLWSTVERMRATAPDDVRQRLLTRGNRIVMWKSRPLSDGRHVVAVGQPHAYVLAGAPPEGGRREPINWGRPDGQILRNAR